jgi:ribosome biogenesis GTPase
LSGRIIKGVGGLYSVDTDAGVFAANARGLFRRQRKTPLPGDFVDVSITDSGRNIAVMTNINPRKNLIARPLAANVDQVVAVVAAETPDINIDMLNRLTVMIEKQGADMIICVNKADLGGRRAEIESIYTTAGFRTVCVSAANRTGIDSIRELLRGKVSILAGPSGVGKTSLINAAFGVGAKTGGLSEKIGRGKHTTRHTELIKIGDGSYIADSPGFTSVSLDGVSKRDLRAYFREFSQFRGQCRFLDCAHINEPGCAVKNNVGGSVPESRYDSYVSFHGGLER